MKTRTTHLHLKPLPYRPIKIQEKSQIKFSPCPLSSKCDFPALTVRMWKFLLVGVFAAAAGISSIWLFVHFTTSPKSYPTAFEIKPTKDTTTAVYEIAYYNHRSAKIKSHNDLLCAPIITAESKVTFVPAEDAADDTTPGKVTKASFSFDSKPVDKELKTLKLRVLYQIQGKEIVMRQIEQIVAKADYELFTLNKQLSDAINSEVKKLGLVNPKDPNNLKAVSDAKLAAIKKSKDAIFADFKDNSGKAVTKKYLYNCEAFLEKNHLDANGEPTLMTVEFDSDTMKNCLREIQKMLSASH